MLRAAALDDNVSFLLSLNKVLTQVLQERDLQAPLQLFSDPEDLRTALAKGYLPHILFLDIDFRGQENGIRLASEINRICPQTKIVYVTAFNDYAQDISDSRFTYYLVKPLRREKLSAAVDKCLRELAQDTSLYISVSVSGAVRRIRLSDLVYLDSWKHDVRYHLANGEVFTCRERLDAAEERLCENQLFLRAHKSYLVNMQHISTMNTEALAMDCGDPNPVSKSQKKNVRETYAAFLMGDLK